MVYISTDNAFGLGGEILRPFRAPGADRSTRDSELRLAGRYTTNNRGKIEFVATVFFGNGRWHLKSRFTHDTLGQRFWGIGPDTPSSNEERFRPKDSRFYAELLRTVFPRMQIGVRGERQHYKYIETEEGGLLDTQPYPGIGADNVLGFGLVAEWDSRDSIYSPSRGHYIQGFALFFSEETGSDYTFNNYYLDARRYFAVRGGDGVLALQGFLFATTGEPPIWRLAQMGGRAHSRGYRRGRYVDRTLLALQAEWRQSVLWRLGVVGFAGLADVAYEFADLRLKTMRPTVGGGLRLRVADRRDISARADVAFGGDTPRFYFSIGHAF
jgi:outer membrane protein assembly factor BamA